MLILLFVCGLCSVPRRCTLTNAKAVVMLLTAILICVNVQFFWSYDLVQLPGEPPVYYCTFTQNELRQSVFFQTKVWPSLDKAVDELLPIGSLTVCSVVMIVCVARGRHHGTAAYRGWRRRYTLEPHGVEQLVWMFINVSVMMVCLILPIAVVNIIKDIRTSGTDDDTASDVVFDRLSRAVSEQVLYFSVSIKVFVYIASSSRFRHELLSVFRLRCK